MNQAIGADLVVDGDFGSKTENAVIAFQNQHGLEATGIADTETIHVLDTLLFPLEESETSEISETQSEISEESLENFVANSKYPLISYVKYTILYVKDFPAHYFEIFYDFFNLIMKISFVAVGAVTILLCLLVCAKIDTSFRFVEDDTFSILDIFDTRPPELKKKYKVEFVKSSVKIFENLSLGIVAVVLILVVLSMLSTPIADAFFLHMCFKIGIWGSIWRTVVYGILRFIVSLIVGVVCFLINVFLVFPVAIMIIILPFKILQMLFKMLFRKEKEAKTEISISKTYSSLTTSDANYLFSFIIALLSVLVLHFIPVLMATPFISTFFSWIPD